MSRRKKWLLSIGIAILSLVVTLAWPGRIKYTVSAETTFITEPLDAKGHPDYVAALNQRLGQGITPEQNANVLIWQALGPRPEGGSGMPPEYFQLLGIEPPSDKGDYFIDRDAYFARHLKPPPIVEEPLPAPNAIEPPDLTKPPPILVDEQNKRSAINVWNDRVDFTRKWPWKATEYPDVAGWLKWNEKSLAVLTQASRRPKYFNPKISKSGAPRLINSLLPTIQKCRAVALALVTRAMLRAGEGDVDGAWGDMKTCRRLGRHVASGGTLIEMLVGIAMEVIATNSELVLIDRVPPSSKRSLVWLKELRELPQASSLADSLDLCERMMLLDAFFSVISAGFESIDRGIGSGNSEPSFWKPYVTRSIDWDPALRSANRMYDRLVATARLGDRAERVAEFRRIVDDLKLGKSTTANLNPIQRSLMSDSERGEAIGNLLLGLLLPALDKMLDAVDRNEQMLRNVQVALALSAYRADHKAYPTRLDALLPTYLDAIPNDIFSRQPLIYRLQNQGYLLYSVGQNGMDDGGQWIDDEPRGDDPRVRMPATKPIDQVEGKNVRD